MTMPTLWTWTLRGSALVLALVGSTGWVEAQGPTVADDPAKVTVRGRVVGAGGAPIERAAVRMGPTSMSFEQVVAHADARTDALGWFQFEARRETCRDVSVAVEGMALARAGVDLLQGAAIDVGDVFVIPGVTIRGRVDDTDGGPLAGVRATMRALGSERSAPGSAQTDAAGIFELRGVSPFVSTLRLEKPGYGPVSVPAVVPASPIRVVMTPAQTIVGSVVDADGAPWPGADVAFHFENGGALGTVCDADGAFELLLPSGVRGRFVASHAAADGVAASALASHQTNRLTLQLDRASTQGTVAVSVAGQGGGPVASFCVVPVWDRSIRSTLDPRWRGSPAYNGSDGRIKLEPDAGWSRSKGWLVVRAEGHGEVAMPIPRPVALGAVPFEIHVTLPAERIVRGRVVGSDGRPVVAARIFVRGLRRILGGGIPNADAWTDGDGRFVVRGLGAHDYAVFAQHDARGIAGTAIVGPEPGEHQVLSRCPP